MISSLVLPHPGVLQRRCVCGGSPGVTGECAECRDRHLIGNSLQPTLRVSEPGDEFEREADQVAEQATRAMETDQEACTPRMNVASAVEKPWSQPVARVDVDDLLSSVGRPLDDAARKFFSARFGHDFSQVRVHADAAAAQSARSLNALAYTVGRDIVFDAGRYDPNSVAGRRLLAHELAHVVQQGGAASAGTAHGAPGNPALIQRQPNSEGPRVRDLPIFLEKLELDVGKNLEDYGHHLYQAATLHPDEPEVLKDAFSRYALGKNVLQTTFKFAGFKADTANKLAVGTGILFKSLTFVREGELTLDFQIDLGRGLKFETNLNLGVDPKNLTDVRKAGVNFGLVRRF